jgi:cell division septation protein DedD
MTTTETSTAPAKKPTAKKKAPAKKPTPPAQTAKYSDDAKVKVLVDKNPRREGTEAHAKFACIKDGDTVGNIVKRAQAKGFNVRGLLIASVKREQISIK